LTSSVADPGDEARRPHAETTLEHPVPLAERAPVRAEARVSAVEEIEDEPRFQTEQERIVRWRVERLLDAGYDGEAALLIGMDLGIDLHAAIDLVLAGCSPETALRILL
jgi:hypothetical protein